MDYVVDDESRICPIKVPGILVDARDAWGCETFDESLERAGQLFIDVSTINRPSVNWHNELIEVYRLDIEQGLSMVTGLNCQRANSITLGWEGKCFYPIRPDFGRLLIQSAFEVPTLNLCELHLLHKFHEQSNRNYSKVMTLHRAIQVGEIALESTHSFKWWLKFWGKRGFAILKNGEPFAHLNAATAPTPDPSIVPSTALRGATGKVQPIETVEKRGRPTAYPWNDFEAELHRKLDDEGLPGWDAPDGKAKLELSGTWRIG